MQQCRRQLSGWRLFFLSVYWLSALAQFENLGELVKNTIFVA